MNNCHLISGISFCIAMVGLSLALWGRRNISIAQRNFETARKECNRAAAIYRGERLE